MFYRIVSLSIFIAILLYCVHYCNAVNSDYVLSYSNPTRDFEAEIEIDQKSTQGNGLSFCSWLKVTSDPAVFFYAKDIQRSKDYILNGINFMKKLIIGVTDRYKSVTVTVSDLENSKWFHLCTVMQEPTIKFFYNGFPAEQYTTKQNISTNKTNNLQLHIGNVHGIDGNGSFYLTNVFDKALTDIEAKYQYNCKSVEGDILSWKDITSKSKEITFKKDINIVKDTVPSLPIDPSVCSKPASVQSPNGMSGSPGTSSGDIDPGSTSGDANPGSSSGGTEPSSSSGGISPSSSSGGTDPSSTSGGSYPGSSSGNIISD